MIQTYLNVLPSNKNFIDFIPVRVKFYGKKSTAIHIRVISVSDRITMLTFQFTHVIVLLAATFL